ncbi:diguanylate cyclase [Pseudomonas sp. UL070]|uniref:Diguanylate cyclase n=1 Tax=Aquipseudomonas ullengensis TaxID=2759166 RepID=A0A7W4LIA2_9GAMM|nr:diguanylate cyclase [Pseudomonas ullengensis]MBB2493704.1 diguanylate cyclase [Pseudomonas ullengensis]
MSLQALLLVACLLSLAGQAFADTVLLHKGSSGQSLNKHIELLEDPSGTLDIADMADPAVQQRFVPAAGRASVGQTRNPWWIKVSLQAAREAPQQWWLEVGSVTQLDLRLYQPNGAAGWQAHESGERVSYAAGRDHDYRHMLFKLPALSESPQTFYLRSYDPAGNSFPLRIWQLDDLTQVATDENLALGVVYGIIAALLLYNLFIFFSLRDSAYFWYVLTTAGALLMILSMSGHGFQHLWPDNPVPFWLDRVTLPSIWGFCACRFTQTLLQTRRHVRWAHHLLTFACVCYVLAIGLEGLDQRYAAAWIIALLSLTSIPAALGAAVIRWRQGYFPALLYLCGYGLILSSISLALMRATGLVQPATWNAYVFPLSVAAESILFSFALAYRIQMLKQERGEALVQADREKTARLAQMQTSADELQSAVKQRTAELAQANQRLSERELELQHAAFHDPLTELPNRRYLIERAETALADAERREESVVLILIDLDHFKPINDRYGHDAGDLLLRSIGQRLREHVRANDMVARLGGDEFAVLICGADAQQHAQEIAGRLLCELAKPVLYGANRLTVTISLGAALYPQHAQQFASLYKAADEALYQAKQQGRSGYVMQGSDGKLSQQACLELDVLKVPSGLI